MDRTIAANGLKTCEARMIDVVTEDESSRGVQKMRIASQWKIFVVVCIADNQPFGSRAVAWEDPWFAVVVTISAWSEIDLRCQRHPVRMLSPCSDGYRFQTVF